MNGWSWLMLHNFLNPIKEAIASISKSLAATLLAKGPRPSTSSSQPRFTAWLHLGISKPSTSTDHLRLIYSSCREALGRIQVGTDLGLHHQGKPRACAASRQLQTTLECCHLAHAQMISHRRQRFVFSGHSQSLQLTGLCKSPH